ncbi:MAG TPA: hypothetical protein VFE50_10090, partial [Cyclobacteriaceae bacterium]|nr:hypothetical protein [Cyclobacteriaceae bacterium]
MKQYPLTRRQMLKASSVTALSAFIPSFSIGKSPVERNAPNVPNNPSDLCFTTAIDLVKLMRAKKVSARDVMQAHLKQIARVNPKVNAIVTLVPEDQLMKEALDADEAIAKGKP